MVTEPEIMQRWQCLVRSTNLDFFFQHFRPYGVGLSEAFEDVPEANKVLPRLLRVFETTAAGFQENLAQDAYFIVRHPLPISHERALQLTQAHFEKMQHLARTSTSTEWKRLLARAPTAEVVQGHVKNVVDIEGPQALLTEIINDLILASKPRPSYLFLLDQAFYHIACDYFLRHYLLWPLYEQAFSLAEPFESYFELWRHGASPILETPELVRTFVPALGN
jgi:hypothetical protein